KRVLRAAADIARERQQISCERCAADLRCAVDLTGTTQDTQGKSSSEVERPAAVAASAFEADFAAVKVVIRHEVIVATDDGVRREHRRSHLLRSGDGQSVLVAEVAVSSDDVEAKSVSMAPGAA